MSKKLKDLLKKSWVFILLAISFYIGYDYALTTQKMFKYGQQKIAYTQSSVIFQGYFSSEKEYFWKRVPVIVLKKNGESIPFYSRKISLEQLEGSKYMLRDDMYLDYKINTWNGEVYAKCEKIKD